MPENDDDLDDLDPGDLRRQLKDAKKEAEAARKEAAEATTLRTENALLKAGLGDLTEKQQAAVLATHDGDLSAEALKATANELGFTKTEAPAEEPQVGADEEAEIRKAADATGGADPSGATVTTDIDKMRALRSNPNASAADLDTLLGLDPISSRT